MLSRVGMTSKSGWEGLGVRGDSVGVDVVPHQHDGLFVGVVDGE